MSVIADLRIPADAFDLGRILSVEGPARITLETMVPLGQTPVPFFAVHDGADEAFAEAVSAHPLIDDLTMIYEHEAETLYGMDWDASADPVFEVVRDLDAQLFDGGRRELGVRAAVRQPRGPRGLPGTLQRTPASRW